MDIGVRTIIGVAETQPQNRDEFCRFFEQIRQLSGAADVGLSPLEGLLASAGGLETLSREIRPVIRNMRQGLTLVLEGRQIMADWVSQIDVLNLDCTASAVAPLPAAT